MKWEKQTDPPLDIWTVTLGKIAHTMLTVRRSNGRDYFAADAYGAINMCRHLLAAETLGVAKAEALNLFRDYVRDLEAEINPK